MIDALLLEKYTKHVLSFEGKLSNDPDDTAASCAPKKGAFHTNKGVTFCTFMKNALSLGMARTYQRFLNLSDADVAKFILLFMESADASELPTPLALSVTEAAWGSGPVRAVKHLQDAINNLGGKVNVDGDLGKETLKAALLLDPAKLYAEYWKERLEFVNLLLANKVYAKWKNGWLRRIKSFRVIFG